jgi:hypothetical protein
VRTLCIARIVWKKAVKLMGHSTSVLLTRGRKCVMFNVGGTRMSLIVALLMCCGAVGLLIIDWGNADIAVAISGVAVITGVFGTAGDDRAI